MFDEFEVIIDFSKKFFWDSINILIKKPHVVNKRIWGCKELHREECIVNFDLLHETLHNLKLDESFNTLSFFENLNSTVSLNELSKDKELNSTTVELILLELLPKNYEENHAFQIVMLDKLNHSVTFYDVTSNTVMQNVCPNFAYSFIWSNKKIILKTFSGNSKSITWLKETVLQHVLKWAQENDNNNIKPHFCSESLCLVDNDKYYVKYNELKNKYGKELVKIWPECTDPAKFVYEDVAIATYLLLIWNSDRQESYQNFVDIGCGNGLLVYILSMEGHNGVGIDVRKRKIWEMYPENVKLEEKTFTPADIKNFSEASWIIGNHSDELTPWIPAIAAHSSYKCNFFLLPCCAYNFDGSKYERHNSSKSQYTEYLEYIKSVCDDVGFRTEFDRLKIPSTKRICLVGRGRSYPETEYRNYCDQIQRYLDTELGNKTEDESYDFKTRDKVERVKNCTKIDKTIIDSIIKIVTDYLLEGREPDSTWSTGRETELGDLIRVIPETKLKMLKSECGGLQTLLKNNHHIFQIINGKVEFRYPKTREEVLESMQKKNKNKDSVKTQVKKCWFYNNHPQGCPLQDNICSFLHDDS